MAGRNVGGNVMYYYKQTLFIFARGVAGGVARIRRMAWKTISLHVRRGYRNIVS
jgi:hypothetical protein